MLAIPRSQTKTMKYTLSTSRAKLVISSLPVALNTAPICHVPTVPIRIHVMLYFSNSSSGRALPSISTFVHRSSEPEAEKKTRGRIAETLLLDPSHFLLPLRFILSGRRSLYRTSSIPNLFLSIGFLSLAPTAPFRLCFASS